MGFRIDTFARAACIAFAAAMLPLSLATAQTQPQFEVKVTIPGEVKVNLMPPVPNPLLVRFKANASLKNNTKTDLVLTRPNPCAVHYWELLDSSGVVLQAKKQEPLCAGRFVVLKLEPGKTVSEENEVVLDGKLLKDKQTYTLRYRYWIFNTEAKFTALVVQ